MRSLRTIQSRSTHDQRVARYAHRHNPAKRQRSKQTRTQRDRGGRQTPEGSVDRANASALAGATDAPGAGAAKARPVTPGAVGDGQTCPVLHNCSVLAAVSASLQHSPTASAMADAMSCCIEQFGSKMRVCADP
jgi:hypothetical protein